MAPRTKNINNRIKELDCEIHKLKQKLTAMIWERDKYLQFDDRNTNEIKHSIH